MSLRSLLLITKWLPQYGRVWFSSDLVAGITLATYAIPASLAYATLASLPPQMGLYCYLVGGLGNLSLGSARYLTIGPTSAISLLLGVSLLDDLEPRWQEESQLDNSGKDRLRQHTSLST